MGAARDLTFNYVPVVGALVIRFAYAGFGTRTDTCWLGTADDTPPEKDGRAVLKKRPVNLCCCVRVLCRLEAAGLP